jgi:hypothetical protein
MMWNNERPAAKSNGGFAKSMMTVGLVAAVGIVAITAGAMAASRGRATPSPGATAGKHHTAGVTTDPPNRHRSDSVVLRLQDLPVRTDLGAWAAIEPTGDGSALACVPARVTDELGAQTSLERRFVARTATAKDDGPYAARIGETVLQFAGQAAAVDAMQSVASWLQDCAGPDVVKHDVLASETVEGPGGGGFWETVLRSAQDFCGGTDCDAVWFDREALLQVGDRLFLVSLAEVGGPLEPDGLTASMHDLVDSAIKAAG